MRKVNTITVLLLLLFYSPALASDLATKITKTGSSTKLETTGYAKLNLLKEKTSLTGPIICTGKLSVTGTANVVMWSKVEGRYYFSKAPNLQNIRNKKNVKFTIPFNPNGKTVTEIIIEVEMYSEGNITISDLSIKNRQYSDISQKKADTLCLSTDCI